MSIPDAVTCFGLFHNLYVYLAMHNNYVLKFNIWDFLVRGYSVTSCPFAVCGCSIPPTIRSAVIISGVLTSLSTSSDLLTFFLLVEPPSLSFEFQFSLLTLPFHSPTVLAVFSRTSSLFPTSQTSKFPFFYVKSQGIDILRENCILRCTVSPTVRRRTHGCVWFSVENITYIFISLFTVYLTVCLEVVW